MSGISIRMASLGTMSGSVIRAVAAPRWLLVLAASGILALSAQISLHLPPSVSPVPITLQSLAVVMIGVMLGARAGAMAVIAYLLEGAAGAPVFAGAAGGAHHLIGPTAGYLWAFVPAAFAAGFLAERGWTSSWRRALPMVIIVKAIIFAGGLLWLSLLGMRGEALLAAGLFPFLPGAVAKFIAALVIIPSCDPQARHRELEHEKA